MKHYWITMLIAIIILLNSCATHRTIMPEISETPRDGLNLVTPVLLSVIDGRGDKKDTDKVIQTLQDGLTRTYGNNIELIDYFSKVPENRVMVRIRIIELGANFGSRIVSGIAIANATSTAEVRAQSGWSSVVATATSNQSIFASSFSGEGWWIGTAWVEFEVQDNRKNNDISFSLPIVAESRESNTLGYTSASRAAKRAWNTVSSQLIQTIDSLIMKVRDEE